MFVSMTSTGPENVSASLRRPSVSRTAIVKRAKPVQRALVSLRQPHVWEMATVKRAKFVKIRFVSKPTDRRLVTKTTTAKMASSVAVVFVSSPSLKKSPNPLKNPK